MRLRKLFQQRQQSTPKNHNPIVPSGLIAHTEKGYFYIKGSKKFKFVSERAMLSWALPVIKTNDQSLSKLITTGTLGFRDGTLIKDISDGKIYLVSDSKRRHIVDPDVLEWLNADIIQASQKEVLVHVEGDPLNGNNT
jgi:hypothetical protein